MKAYGYFIISFFLVIFMFTSFYVTVNLVQKDGNSAIASDLGTEEARFSAIQPYIRSNDSAFKTEFSNEVDKAVKTIKKIRDIYTTQE